MRKYFIAISLVLLICSCTSQKERQKEKVEHYSALVKFEEQSEVEKLKYKLESILNDTLIIKNTSLQIGLFDSYREAADKGFELYADTLIPNFSVIYNDSLIANDYTPLYFIGKYLDRPALYKTDITKIKPKLVWSKWGRKILHLYRSDKRKSYYFTTTLHEALRGSFPLVMDTKLYSFNRENEKVNLLLKAGNVMNIRGNWESDSIFTTYYTILDSMITSTLVQYQYDCDLKGEIIDSTERIFELINDGIPVPNSTNINPVSNDHRYRMATVKNDSTLKLNIIDELNGTNNVILNLTGEIKENRWNETNDYLFLTTSVSQDSTDLFIINLERMELVRKFSGRGDKNFTIIGNLLIFDDMFDFDSYITMFRYRKDQIYSEIKIIGGCGVNSIPKKEKIF